MGMDILIEELEGSIWVAAIKNKRLHSLEVDPYSEEVRWGSIYRAKVERIDATMEAAFVRLDVDNMGILNAKDVLIRDKNGDYKRDKETPIGKLLKPGQYVLVQAKAGYLPKEDPSDETLEEKSPRVSMNITLPGRYLIYTPLDPNNVVSRRIRNKKLRKQLLEMLNAMEGCDNCTGCILRAASANTQTEILSEEHRILKAMWEQMSAYNKGDDYGLIMAGPDAIQRTFSDQAGELIERIEVVTMEHFQDAEEWCELFAPDLVTKIVPVDLEGKDRGMGLFDFHDLVGQIEKLIHPYAVLESGGNIIIQRTAALTAIDVNKGKDNRGHLAINIEAGQEIARQLRIRNMGGIIMIDALKMRNKKDKDALIKSLQDAFDDDPCTVHLHGYTALGLIEISRSRRTPPLQDRFDSVLES